MTLAGMMPIPLSYLQAKYRIPAPAAGEEATQVHTAKKNDPKPGDGTGGKETDPTDPTDENDGPDGTAKTDGKDDKEPLAARLGAMLEITDDALFAKELRKLAEEL